jgi:hypothetical protein
MGTSDFARDVFETAKSKYEAHSERLQRGLAAHRHSYSALRIHHQHCNRRFGHLARKDPAVLAGSRATVTPS